MSQELDRATLAPMGEGGCLQLSSPLSRAHIRDFASQCAYYARIADIVVYDTQGMTAEAYPTHMRASVDVNHHVSLLEREQAAAMLRLLPPMCLWAPRAI
ncbi:hypothetical protein ACI68E_002547 [Malassezia pachydermatis]